jgi:tol-pal system beta propeller repeat protein TolB
VRLSAILAVCLAGCAAGWIAVELGETPPAVSGPIAYVSNAGGDWDIWIVEPGRVPEKAVDHPGGDWGPVFAPDCSALYFFSERAGALDVFRLDLATGVAENITRTSADEEREPAASPDGRRLVFTGDRDGDEEVYVMSLASRDIKQITFNHASDREPSFAPDGRHVVFVSDRDGNDELYITNIEGGFEHRLTRTQASESHPSVSNDGRHIAFSSDRVGHYEVYTLDTRTGVTRRITAPLMFDNAIEGRYMGSQAPCFSPSGDMIAFDARFGASTEVYVCALDGTRLRSVTDARLMLPVSTQQYSAVTNGVPDWGSGHMSGVD